MITLKRFIKDWLVITAGIAAVLAAPGLIAVAAVYHSWVWGLAAFLYLTLLITAVIFTSGSNSD